MSVRAYRRISEPKFADDSTFNLWHEPEVLDFLTSLESTWCNDAPDNPEIEVYLSELEPALKTAAISKEAKKALKADIEAVKKEGNDFIFYGSW